MTRFRNKRWRWLVLFAAVLLLAVQVGLAVHGASHLYRAGKAGGCQLCVLICHFVAEIPTDPYLEPARLVVVLFPEETEAPAEQASRISVARGPPSVSV